MRGFPGVSDRIQRILVASCKTGRRASKETGELGGKEFREGHHDNPGAARQIEMRRREVRGVAFVGFILSTGLGYGNSGLGNIGNLLTRLGSD
jgi:hypothetical protein